MKNQAIHGEIDVLGSLSFSKNNASVPANPKPRQISIINGQPCIYTDIGQGFYSWFPMGVKQSAYVHSQGVAAITWTITHGMDTNDYGVFVYDTNHSLQLVNTEVLDSNTIRIELNEATAGTAVVFGIPGQAAVGGGIQTLGSVADVVGLIDSLALKANVTDTNAMQTAIDGKASASALSTETTMRVNADIALQNAIDTKANTSGLAVVATTGAYSDLTGKPTALSSFSNDQSYQSATQVNASIQAVVGAAPEALNTLQEIATQLANDESAASALATAVSGKAAAVHGHAISDVTSLQSSLDGKAASSHVHAISDVTSLQTAIDAKASLSTNTFTGVQKFGAAVYETKVDLGVGSVINLSLGNMFTKTISGATTLSVSSTTVAGNVASFMLELTNAGTNITSDLPESPPKHLKFWTIPSSVAFLTGVSRPPQHATTLRRESLLPSR